MMFCHINKSPKLNSLPYYLAANPPKSEAVDGDSLALLLLTLFKQCIDNTLGVNNNTLRI